MFLLFDLDGTLTDSNGLWLDVDIEFARRRGLSVTQEYTDFVTHSIFTTAADFTKEYYHLPESPAEIMEEWLALSYDAYTHCAARPGAVEFLTACREAQLPMAVVTASMPRLCQAALTHLGVSDWFRFILYAQDLGLEKRDPRVWQEAARMAGCLPSDCLVFDDSPVACASAQQAGCRVVGVYDELYAAFRADMKRDCWRYIRDFQGHSPAEFMS